MLSQKEVKIGANSYIIQTLPSSEALKFGVYFAKVFNDALRGIDDRVDFINPPSLRVSVSSMVYFLSQKLDDKTLPAAIKDLLSKSIAQPTYSDNWYELHFSGNLQELLELVAAVLDYNYSDALLLAKKKIEELLDLSFTVEDRTKKTPA